MPAVQSTNLPVSEPPPAETTRTAAPSVARFTPPGATFADWRAEAEYLAAMPPGLGMPSELIGQPEAVFMRMKFAEALDIPLMIAIQDIYVIGEKTGMSAALVRALMHRAGMQFWFPHHDATICIMRLRRPESPDQVFEVIWTIEEAEAAGLLSNAKTGQTWQAYPADCLVAAATRRMGRRHAADITRGFGYGRDELALAQASAPFAANATQLAMQVAEVVDDAMTATGLEALKQVCLSAEERSLMDQLTDEHGPAAGESVRVFLLQRWAALSGDMTAAPAAAAPAPPERRAAARSGRPEQWLHGDCGRCKMMSVLVNGDHDPGCEWRAARPADSEGADQ